MMCNKMALHTYQLSGCFTKHCWLATQQAQITENTCGSLTFFASSPPSGGGDISNCTTGREDIKWGYLHMADSVHTSFVWREWFPQGCWQACLCCSETLGTVKHPAVQPVVHLPLSQLAGWPPTSLSLSPYLALSLNPLYLYYPPPFPLSLLLRITYSSLLHTINFQVHFSL